MGAFGFWHQENIESYELMLALNVDGKSESDEYDVENQKQTTLFKSGQGIKLKLLCLSLTIAKL